MALLHYFLEPRTNILLHIPPSLAVLLHMLPPVLLLEVWAQSQTAVLSPGLPHSAGALAWRVVDGEHREHQPLGSKEVVLSYAQSFEIVNRDSKLW